MPSIKFDGTELVTTGYMPRWAAHESAPSRKVGMAEREDRDGYEFVSSRYGEKRIRVRGTLTAATKDALDAAIDAFKELMSREQKTLAVDFSGGTRNYIATCESLDIDRDFADFTAVPWTAVFVVPSGEGKDTASTKALDAHAVTVTTPGTDSFTLGGSKAQRPVITIENNLSGSAPYKGIKYENTDTGESIIFTKNASWQAGCKVVIDCENMEVTSDIGTATQVAGDFIGTFPTFKVGTNNVKITAGSIVNQTSPDTVITDASGVALLKLTTKGKAQSFRLPYGNDTFQQIVLGIAKVGSPGAITVRLETDADGAPSGNLADAVNSSSLTIAAAAVGASAAYVTGRFSAMQELPANETLWIVIYAAGVDNSNYYEFSYLDLNTAVGYYRNGKAMYTEDSGATWADETTAKTYCFRVLFGGEGGSSAGVDHTVEYVKTWI